MAIAKIARKPEMISEPNNGLGIVWAADIQTDSGGISKWSARMAIPSELRK
jgi:hypothetical protein